MIDWKRDGSICPICGGEGRHSKRYPAALCRLCEEELVDSQGQKAIIQAVEPKPGSDAPWGTGLVIEAGKNSFLKILYFMRVARSAKLRKRIWVELLFNRWQPGQPDRMDEADQGRAQITWLRF